MGNASVAEWRYIYMSKVSKTLSYPERLLVLANVKLPEGMKPKRSCKTCYGSTGKKLTITPEYYDRATRSYIKSPVKADLCDCIKRQMKLIKERIKDNERKV